MPLWKCYHLSSHILVRGNNKSAYRLILFSDFHHLLLQHLHFFPHALRDNAHLSAFMPENIRLIFLFLNFFRELGVPAVLPFYPGGNFFHHTEIIAAILLYLPGVG